MTERSQLEKIVKNIKVEDDLSKYELEMKKVQENYLKDIQKQMTSLYAGLHLNSCIPVVKEEETT